ncbi:40S ribosomal protein S5 [Anaeramoeba flamelloides]|uniref:40S ribosomal protein S5 n=1 Tax=Anaeramoeba flamelloides TaxID=1746091 RepID=A0AAV7ZWB3_9EUKA|nr:40S ribosomal protein S5 [Anaeramoeba flamelloides]KAJ3439508.1 40S ribosomal protein S5 [Anaeramoeba flamelloides]KAJ3444189.1 40S ribosomal protein S5 [Anaeramoeba flamelloides]KAJ6246842.1 40S ribosomal protein S5 [Anaeramoeba flamelloides]KAJ6248756.1 40S ribosomal protein S5 [Anaeramoeba flamelloides]
MTQYEEQESETQKEPEIELESATEIKLFGKWSYEGLKVSDMSLEDQMSWKPNSRRFLTHSSGRWQVKPFRKIKCPIVERFVCSLMMHGRNAGKKMMAIRILKHTFEIINLITEENPIQVLLDAITNSGPREDTTRVGKGGGARRQAVDVSPLRRVNIGIYYLCFGARKSAFRNTKSISECLADELINAAKGNSTSFAVKKKDEIERVARSNR